MLPDIHAAIIYSNQLAMRTYFIGILVSIIPLTIISQPCPDSLYFHTQAQVDSFQINYPNCTTIEGNVTISGDDITNLDGLNNLTEIQGSLNIGTGINMFLVWFCDGNPPLKSLAGLNNLTNIGGNLEILCNDSLTSLTGLNNLTSIGGYLSITCSKTLTNLVGLENLTSVDGDVYIGLRLSGMFPPYFHETDNSALGSFEGLNNLAFIGGDFHIGRNSTQINLTGLEGLAYIGGSLFICDNPHLTSLVGLENLISVGGIHIGYYAEFSCHGNPSLTSLTGLNNLTTINGDLEISCNELLNDLNGLENLTSIEGSLTIGTYKGAIPSGICHGNPSLPSLLALSNLTSIGGILRIQCNDTLTSLEGLDNIDAGSIEDLAIYENPNLSTCEVLSVCNYLSALTDFTNIYNNAAGCNSQEEVLDSCEANAVSLPERYVLEDFCINPNPFTTSTTITYTLNSPSTITIRIFNPQGQLIEQIERKQREGEQQIHWNAAGLPSGIYYLKLRAGSHFVSRRVTLIR
jgi:hypothetical protein